MATKKKDTDVTEATTTDETVAGSQATTVETPDVAPAPLADQAGTGAPNAIPESQTENAEAVVEAAAPGLLDSDGKVPAETVDKYRQVLGDMGVTPAPETVNGVSVVGKKLNAAGDAYEEDKDAAQAAGRVEDIFDRIAAASPNEGIRLVLEEIARLAGATSENTQEYPEGTTGTFQTGKSTASLRHDLDDTKTTAAPVAGATDSK